MGTLQEEARKARFEAIMDLISASPKSIQQIADAIGITYITARRDVQTLVNSGLCRAAAARGENGKMLFVKGSKRAMPEVYNEATDTMVPLSALAEAYLQAVTSGQNTGAMQAALGVLEVAADLMHKVAFLEAGGELTKKNLNDVRASLIRYKTLLSSTTHLAQQMIDNISLWDPKYLETIASDEEWDGTRMENIYQQAQEIIGG